MPDSHSEQPDSTVDVEEPGFVPSREFRSVLDELNALAGQYLATPVAVGVTTRNNETYTLHAANVRGYYSPDYEPDAASTVKVTDVVIYQSKTGRFTWNTILEYNETESGSVREVEMRTLDVSVSIVLETGESGRTNRDAASSVNADNFNDLL